MKPRSIAMSPRDFGTQYALLSGVIAAVVAARQYATEHTYGPPRAELVTRLFQLCCETACGAIDAAEDFGCGSTPQPQSPLRFSSLTFHGGNTMVAINRKRIHCVVVAVPIEADLFAERGALAHEMVPGADPYVAQLIQRLQDEVRHERQMEQLQERASRLTRHARFEQQDLVGDLELPVFDIPFEDEPLGEENIPEYGDN